MQDSTTFIGRVTRSSTRGFIGAIRTPEPEIPTFGGFCRARAQRGNSDVIGVIYNINIEDDDLTRQLATAEHPTQEELADHQFVRHIPIEFEALAVGYLVDDTYHYHLPPQPPLALAPIQSMGKDEIREFTRNLDFIPLILAASTLPVDELLSAALRIAANARQPSEAKDFLLNAGRFCAHQLSADLNRLDRFLHNINLSKESGI